MMSDFPVILPPMSTLGGLHALDDSPALPDGSWYEADEIEDGFGCEFAPPARSQARRT